MSALINLSSQQLRRIADIKEKIDSLEHELDQLVGGGGLKRKSGMSASGRARIAAAQRARWAKVRKGKIPAYAAGKGKRTLSAAAKAKIAAAARARWARAKAAGKRRL